MGWYLRSTYTFAARVCHEGFESAMRTVVSINQGDRSTSTQHRLVPDQRAEGSATGDEQVRQCLRLPADALLRLCRREHRVFEVRRGGVERRCQCGRRSVG